MPQGRAKPVPAARAPVSPSPPPPPPAAPSPDAPSLALTLTIRHLPSDRWQSFSVPREWRVEQVKAAALASFAHPVAARPAAASPRPPAASSRSAGEAVESGRLSSIRRRTSTATSGRSKENEDVHVLDSQAVPAQRASDGSSGGLRAVVKATSSMANKLSPFPSRSPRTLRFTPSSVAPPVPPFPTRQVYDTVGPPAPSSSRPSLSLDLTSTFSTSTASVAASGIRSTAPFASSSFVEADDEDDLCTPTAERSQEDLPEVNAQTPSQALWPEYGTKRVERGGRSTSSKLLSLGRRFKADKKHEQLESSSWCLVKAITGSYTSDQRIVGSTFVDQDLLILKPRLLSFDPPLHLLHLPYLHLSRVELLTTPLADLALDPSSPTTPKRSKRRSWGSAPRNDPLFVDRVLEISVEDAEPDGGEHGAAERAPVMLLRIFEYSNLKQTYDLPASQIRLVLLGPSSPTDSFLDMTPSAGQHPSTSLPIISLELEGDSRVAFRPTSRADLDSLLDLLGDEDETSDLLYEGEMERRKNIVDAAYRSRHCLPLALPLARPPSAPLPPPPPSSPIIPLSPSQPISRRRSLNSPPSSRRAGLAKSTTQLVLSRVPSDDEPASTHPHQQHSSSGSTSAESLAGGGASGFATAPTSPAHGPPSTGRSRSTGGAASSLTPPVLPARSPLRPRSPLSTSAADKGGETRARRV